MEKFRISNDLSIFWSITNKDGSPYTLSDKTVRLFVTHPRGRMEVTQDITIQGNVICWLFRGSRQRYLGTYRITAEIQASPADRTIRKDIPEAFELVSSTQYEQTEIGRPDINEEGELTLATSLDIFQIKPIIPQVGPNRNWWVDGVDTGKSSVGLTAYEFAKEQGYEGTEEEYAAECLAVPVLNEESRSATGEAIQATEDSIAQQEKVSSYMKDVAEPTIERATAAALNAEQVAADIRSEADAALEDVDAAIESVNEAAESANRAASNATSAATRAEAEADRVESNLSQINSYMNGTVNPAVTSARNAAAEAASAASKAAKDVQTAIAEIDPVLNNKADKIKFEGKSYVDTYGISTHDFYYSMPNSADGTEDDIIATKNYLKKINGQDLYGKGNIVIEGKNYDNEIATLQQKDAEQSAQLAELSAEIGEIEGEVMGVIGKETLTSNKKRIGLWVDNTPNIGSYKFRITCDNPPIDKFKIYKATAAHGGLEIIVQDAAFSTWVEIERDEAKPALYIYNNLAADETIDAVSYEIGFKGKTLREEVEAMANNNYAFYKDSPKTYNKPLVCMVFDVPIDYLPDARISEFMDFCDSLNLKVSIATSTKPDFRKVIEENGWFERMQNGHDIVSYPIDNDVKNNVGSTGFGSCDEASVMARYEKNRAAFDSCGIRMDVGIWHNSSDKIPSAFSQALELYNHIIGGLGRQYIQEMCEDLCAWNRYKLEGSTFATLKTFFDAALGQQKVVVFGTHLVTSNGVMLQYDNFINEVKPFLTYVAGLVNAGLVASVSVHKALDAVKNERAKHNYIPWKRYNFTANNLEFFRYGSAISRVTNGGTPYVFKLDIGGTASGGTISITIDGHRGAETKEIAVASGLSAEAVAALFYTHAFFSNYRTKVVGSSVYFHRCRTDNADVSFEISNTSGVTITKTDIVNAVAHTVTNS